MSKKCCLLMYIFLLSGCNHLTPDTVVKPNQSACMDKLKKEISFLLRKKSGDPVLSKAKHEDINEVITTVIDKFKNPPSCHDLGLHLQFQDKINGSTEKRSVSLHRFKYYSRMLCVLKLHKVETLPKWGTQNYSLIEARELPLCVCNSIYSNINGNTTNYHIVKTGEDIICIANMYGLSKKDIASWNNLPPSYAIKTGQRLVLNGPEIN